MKKFFSVIFTLMLISVMVSCKQSSNRPLLTASPEPTFSVSSETAMPTPSEVTKTPDVIETSAILSTPTETVKPTATIQATATVNPTETVKPTATVQATATVTPSATATATASPVPENAPYIKLETVKALSGDTVKLKVELNNNPGIWGLDVSVNYDKSALTLVNVTNGDVFSDGAWTAGNLKGEKYVLSYALNTFTDIKTNGTLATLEFKVLSSPSEITLNYNPGDIIDVSFNEINFSLINGGVK